VSHVGRVHRLIAVSRRVTSVSCLGQQKGGPSSGLLGSQHAVGPERETTGSPVRTVLDQIPTLARWQNAKAESAYEVVPDKYVTSARLG